MEQWILPCNTNKFDVTKHFKTASLVVWKNTFSMKTGDIAYIYLTLPYQEIRYRCLVVSDKVDDEMLADNQYAVNNKKTIDYCAKKVQYVLLQLDREYPSGLFSLTVLHEHGVGQVQCQARVSRKTKAFIEAIEHDNVLDTRG